MGELLDCAFSLYRKNFWKFAGALAVVFLFVKPAFAADAPPISLDAYWILLETTHTRLTELVDTPLENARPALDDLAVQWDSVTVVELPDGTLLPVDTQYISTQLRTETPDLPLLTRLLEHALETRDTWPQGNFGNADLAKLDSVLRQPEFQWQPETLNPFQEFLRNLIRRINKAYIEFLEWLFPDSGGVISVPVNLIFTIAGTIILIVMFLYILRGTWGNILAEAENSADTGEEIPLTAETARQRARELSQAGDHRNAIRYLYLASLLLLEERGLLRFDRSLTNRETLRSVENRPDLAAPLKDVVETFDRVWYGYQEVDEPTFEHYAERVEDLKAQK